MVPSPFDFMPIKSRQQKKLHRKYKVISTKVKRPLALTPTSVYMKKSRTEDCTYKWDIAYNRHLPGTVPDMCKDCGKLRFTNPVTIVPFPPTNPFKDYIKLIEEEEKRLGSEETIAKDEGLVHRITQRLRSTTADLSILWYDRDSNTHSPHLNTKLEPQHQATRVNQEDFLAQVTKIDPNAPDHRY